MENYKQPSEIFDELKKELDFLPEEGNARSAFIDAFVYALLF